ncbi:MAG: VWA domain-containing protein [Gammaproteobacteria bacterium]|nr:VWA domain-containing protein [Gammaproteobacteria bacterium]
MNTKLIAIALFTATAAAVAAYPAIEAFDAKKTIANPLASRNPQQQHQPKVDVVFVLDTTGSMGGMIEAAKEKIWSIASNMASAQPAPEIRIGLVAFRDRGDAYVTQLRDLSSDMDSMYATLMDYQADGGGDGPESVNKALDDALNQMSWSREQDTYKVIFLVGDAPPHMDYPNERQFPEIVAEAKARQIVVNTVQCGQDSSARKSWMTIAQLGAGEYFQVDQAGSALALATPFDKKIAALSKKLDDTRLYYGTEKQKEKQQLKLAAAEKLHAGSTVESLARRAEYNLSKSGEANFLGENELVDDIASGRIELDSIERKSLPAAMQAMAPAEQQRLIEEKAEQRKMLRQEIEALSRDRSDYLDQKVNALGSSKDSLDYKIQSAVKAQAAKKGLDYDASRMRY